MGRYGELSRDSSIPQVPERPTGTWRDSMEQRFLALDRTA
jgi:hypothetical protein